MGADHRHPLRRLRPLRRGRDLAGQCRARHLAWGPDAIEPGPVWLRRRSGIGVAGRRLQRLLHRVPAPAADRRDAVHHVHRAGHHAAGHGQARRHDRAGSSALLLAGDAIPGCCPHADRSCSAVVASALGLAQEHALRHRRSMRSAATRGRGPRRRRARTRASQLLRLRARRRVLRARRGFISAQTGSADPLVGNPLLLRSSPPSCVGGTRLGGGRGGAVGTIFGAYILMIVVNILLVLNVSAYYSTIAEGAILSLAVLAGFAHPATRRSPTICASAAQAARARAPARLPSRTWPPADRSPPPPSRRRPWRDGARSSSATREHAPLRAAGLCLLRGRARRDPVWSMATP